MQHLDEGTIHAWLDGELPTVEAEQVAKHAAECATCAAAVAEARGIIAGSARIVSALDDVPGGVIPGRAMPAAGPTLWRRLRFTPGRAAHAATILLAVSATLTLRSSSSSLPSTSTADSVISAVPPKMPRAVAVPQIAPTTVDSLKTPGPPSQSVNASEARKTRVSESKPRPQVAAAQREAADALAPRDTTVRELAKARAVLQEPAAGASGAAAPPAAPSTVRGNFNSARALDLRDSASTFEGCYRVSADSSSGSTAIPRGLPTSFTLSRPSPETRMMASRLAPLRADSGSVLITAWRPLSTNQVNVTFGLENGRPVSLVLTSGSPVAVASSGDRSTVVRVSRAACPP